MMRMQVVANMSRLATLFTPYFSLIQAKRGDEEDQVRAAEAFNKWYASGSNEDLEDLCKQRFALEENCGRRREGKEPSNRRVTTSRSG